jgi:hypothetical protein
MEDAQFRRREGAKKYKDATAVLYYQVEGPALRFSPALVWIGNFVIVG